MGRDIGLSMTTYKNDAKRALRAWETRVRDSGLTCFDNFLKTLHRHWEAITNYFVDLLTSGFVEGLNNKLKVLKRRCYGISNLDHFFQRIFLDLEGYRQGSLNEALVRPARSLRKKASGT